MNAYSPRVLPLPPTPPPGHRLEGPVEDAYNAAVSARNAALAKYDVDNPQQSADAGQYNADNAAYLSQINANPPELTGQNATDCFNALAGAYGAWSTEHEKVLSANDNFGAGDANLDAGNNAQNQQQKIMLYNTAKSYYNTAASRCTDAETAHASFVTFISAAEAILY